MKRLLFLTILIQLSLLIHAQIYVDGLFNDWTNIEKIVQQKSGIEYLSIYDDINYLYISFKVGKEIKLNKEQNIILFINSDNDIKTGKSDNGYDYAMDFSHRKGIACESESGNLISSYYLGLHYLPTISSDKFEIAVAKDSLNINSDIIGLSLINGLKKVDLVSPIDYKLQNNLISFKNVKVHKKSWNTIRFITLNVNHDGIIKEKTQKDIIKTIGLINPDILTLNECWDATPDTISKLFTSNFPKYTWHVNKSDDGNITVSKFPIIKSVPILKKYRITANFIKRNKDTLLVINCHFRCCDNDKARNREVAAVLRYLNKLKKHNINYPLVIMGDFNFVGESKQFENIINGENDKPDWDNTSLTNLVAKQVNSNFTYTWYNEGSDYSPGKLDFIVYSDSRLVPKKSFVFNSLYLPDKQLKKYKIDKELTKRLSDHLPVVADFKITKIK